MEIVKFFIYGLVFQILISLGFQCYISKIEDGDDYYEKYKNFNNKLKEGLGEI